jgi:hypothetical protein
MPEALAYLRSKGKGKGESKSNRKSKGKCGDLSASHRDEAAMLRSR